MSHFCFLSTPDQVIAFLHKLLDGKGAKRAKRVDEYYDIFNPDREIDDLKEDCSDITWALVNQYHLVQKLTFSMKHDPFTSKEVLGDWLIKAAKERCSWTFFDDHDEYNGEWTEAYTHMIEDIQQDAGRCDWTRSEFIADAIWEGVYKPFLYDGDKVDPEKLKILRQMYWQIDGIREEVVWTFCNGLSKSCYYNSYIISSLKSEPDAQ